MNEPHRTPQPLTRTTFCAPPSQWLANPDGDGVHAAFPTDDTDPGTCPVVRVGGQTPATGSMPCFWLPRLTREPLDVALSTFADLRGDTDRKRQRRADLLAALDPTRPRPFPYATWPIPTPQGHGDDLGNISLAVSLDLGLWHGWQLTDRRAFIARTRPNGDPWPHDEEAQERWRTELDQLREHDAAHRYGRVQLTTEETAAIESRGRFLYRALRVQALREAVYDRAQNRRERTGQQPQTPTEYRRDERRRVTKTVERRQRAGRRLLAHVGVWPWACFPDGELPKPPVSRAASAVDYWRVEPDGRAATALQAWLDGN